MRRRRQLDNAAGVAARAAWSVCAVLTVAALLPLHEARAQDWVLRHVALEQGALPSNVDVMLDPAGGVIVGYTLPSPGMIPGAGGVPVAGPLMLSTLHAGDPFFEHRTAPELAYSASFDVDRFGTVYFATRDDRPGAVGVGVDYAPAGGLLRDTLGGDPMLVDGFSPPTLAVDRAGLPHVAWAPDSITPRVLARFDVPASQWVDQFVGPPVESAGPLAPDNRQSLAFDTANRGAVALVSGVTSRLSVLREGEFGWQPVVDAPALAPMGTSIAADAAGGVGFAFNASGGGLMFGSAGDAGDGAGGFGAAVIELVAPGSHRLTPRSLAYDADGLPAIVYNAAANASDAGPLHLARRDAAGQWHDETLPVDAYFASLRFDVANNATIAAVTPAGVTLLAPGIAALLAGDFDLSTAVTGADVPGFAQALRDPPGYLGAHPQLSPADVLTLGDFTADQGFTDADARALADGLGANPRLGLANRTAGYVAFDQADVPPNSPDGDGNFFNTTLATPKPYAPGDARGDLTDVSPFAMQPPSQAISAPALAPVPDGRVDGFDIDYVFANVNQPSPDLRADLNDDGGVDTSDVDELVNVILGTFYGDVNLDAMVDFADVTQLSPNFGQPAGAGWAMGDVTGDRAVDFADLSIIAANFGAGTEAGRSPVPPQQLLAALPEPGTAMMMLPAIVAMTWRRRRMRVTPC